MKVSRFRPSPAMAVACIALAIALGGAGYAAIRLPRNSVGTRQVKDYSLLRRDFKRGQVPRGPEGPQGPQGPQGAQGIAGPAGPVTGDLPTGATLRGTYGVTMYSTSLLDREHATISFGLRPPSGPQQHFIASGDTPPAQCPGTAADPAALPGHLCIYETFASSRGGVLLINPITGDENKPTASRYGVLVSVSPSAVPNVVETRGTWALAAP